MQIIKTGNVVPITDIIKENKFKCFLTNEVYCETENGTLVRLAEINKEG